MEVAPADESGDGEGEERTEGEAGLDGPLPWSPAAGKGKGGYGGGYADTVEGDGGEQVTQPPTGDEAQIAQFNTQARVGRLAVAKAVLMPMAKGGGDL